MLNKTVPSVSLGILFSQSVSPTLDILSIISLPIIINELSFVSTKSCATEDVSNE